MAVIELYHKYMEYYRSKKIYLNKNSNHGAPVFNVANDHFLRFPQGCVYSVSTVIGRLDTTVTRMERSAHRHDHQTISNCANLNN